MECGHVADIALCCTCHPTYVVGSVSEGVKCRLQVRDAGHCCTITETTQSFAKMLTLGLNLIFWALC